MLLGHIRIVFNLGGACQQESRRIRLRSAINYTEGPGSAALVHYVNALWSVYERRYLRLSRWEWWQLSLGLCIPPLLMDGKLWVSPAPDVDACSIPRSRHCRIHLSWASYVRLGASLTRPTQF